ncbi:MAG: hypothetical protein LBQ24_07410 [Candidatus Peribacteria bacterium]|nr:hypothetical protein [Candidatus Peribacteria bacterium]
MNTGLVIQVPLFINI